MERGLHRRRSRRRQRDVGRREDGVRVAFDDGHPGGDGLHRIEQPIGEIRRARDDELDGGDLRTHAVDNAGWVDSDVQPVLPFPFSRLVNA